MEEKTTTLKGKPEDPGRARFSFLYEGKTYFTAEPLLTIREIKVIVGQDPDVAIAQIVEGRQVERPNDYIVNLAEVHSFKRVPEFVRG
jgi:hypothetical protein